MLCDGRLPFDHLLLTTIRTNPRAVLKQDQAFGFNGILRRELQQPFKLL
jgi:hypothetical protein